MPSSRARVEVTIITDYEAGEFGLKDQADLLKAFQTAGWPAPQITLHNGDGRSDDPSPPPSAQPPPPAPVAAAAEPAKRRGRPAKAAAPSPVVEDTGLADTDPLDLNGPTVGDPADDDDDDAETLGLAAPSMTGQDALEAGLGKVRVIFAKGHRSSIKDLQKQFNVASFADIPATEGHRFLASVVKLEEQLGLRV